MEGSDERDELAERRDAAGPADVPRDGENADADAPEDAEVTQLSISGDADLTATIGGRKPNESVIVVRGGEISVPGGQFAKGQRVRMVFEGPIAEVHLVDKRDSKTGDVTATKRKHVMKPDTIEKQELQVAPSEAA